MKASVALVSVFILILLVLAPAHVLLAQGGLVPGCEGFGCKYGDLVTLAQNVINWLVVFSATVAALMFVYAGILYVTAAANPSQIQRAHKIFWSVIIGFIFILTAWLIVNAIVTGLTGDSGTCGIDSDGNVICF